MKLGEEINDRGLRSLENELVMVEEETRCRMKDTYY